ncbi:MAG: BON domain-containing protein [Alphaproteobacteria bacterium]|nr:BON domain-containing protein [Alphaproteobacteria bacterium]
MTVIAMTREMGTLGKDVAAELAEALHMEVVHQELVEHHLAERLQLGESTVHRFLEGNASLWERWKIGSDRMSRYTAEEILELANKGNVLIRGWGAAQLLRDVSHVLCVRVCAPMSFRVSVMLERLGLSDERSMRHEIERNDNGHSRVIQRQFNADWRRPENYDIVLNTGFVSVASCVSVIQQLASSPAYKETPSSRGNLIDKVIEAEVRKILDAFAPDTPYGSGIDISVSKGKVVLSGVVGGTGSINGAIGRIQKIDGVTDIEDNVAFVPVNSGV